VHTTRCRLVSAGAQPFSLKRETSTPLERFKDQPVSIHLSGLNSLSPGYPGKPGLLGSRSRLGWPVFRSAARRQASQEDTHLGAASFADLREDIDWYTPGGDR